jgi:hypothetical protein
MNTMKTPSTLLAALLLTLASAAYADTASGTNPPPKPVTGEGAATTVSTNPASVESKGKADKGLDTAVSNIDKRTHGKTRTHHRNSRQSGAEERAEHPSRMERPDVPEHPGR